MNKSARRIAIYDLVLYESIVYMVTQATRKRITLVSWVRTTHDNHISIQEITPDMAQVVGQVSADPAWIVITIGEATYRIIRDDQELAERMRSFLHETFEVRFVACASTNWLRHRPELVPGSTQQYMVIEDMLFLNRREPMKIFTAELKFYVARGFRALYQTPEGFFLLDLERGSVQPIGTPQYRDQNGDVLQVGSPLYYACIIDYLDIVVRGEDPGYSPEDLQGEAPDTYDYHRDDLNYDTARERRFQ